MTAAGARSEFSASGYNWRLYLPYLVHVCIAQAIIAIARVATTYRAIELDLPVIWIGAISGCFALLPMVLAVRLGRWLDKGRDSETVWAGSGLMLVSTFGLWQFSHSPWFLALFTATLGVGHLCIMAGHQTLAMRCSEPRNRESVFGMYMVLIAIGQGMGPLLIGWIGQGLRIAPSDPLFRISVYAAVVMCSIAFLLYRAPPKPAQSKEKPRVPIATLLRIRGFTAFLLASVMTVTSLDLLIVYLPLLGTERGIDAGTIGVLMTIRSVTTMLSRMLFARLVGIFGRTPLVISCLLAGGFAFVLMAAPVPVWAIGVSSILIGYGMGLAATLSLSGVVDLAPPEAQGTAVTLRITGNRIGQVALPLLGGFIAAAAGAAGVMAIIGGALGLSGFAVWASQRRAQR